MMWNLETYNRSICKTYRKRDYYKIVHKFKTNLVNVLKKLKKIIWCFKKVYIEKLLEKGRKRN